jgi:hypothetical protein
MYLSLLLLLACSDEEAKAAKAAEEAKITEAVWVAETSKQTKLMLEEVDATFNLMKTENKTSELSQKVYLKLDILPEKYPQADPEAVAIVKEARGLFEELYIKGREYEPSMAAFAKALGYAVNTVTNNGRTLQESLNEMENAKKEISERANKLQFHFEQLGTNMCSKYQIRCKEKR